MTDGVVQIVTGSGERGDEERVTLFVLQPAPEDGEEEGDGE